MLIILHLDDVYLLAMPQKNYQTLLIFEKEKFVYWDLLFWNINILGHIH